MRAREKIEKVLQIPNRPVAQIIADLQQVECELSPENLHCDGEISPAQANKKWRILMKRRAELVKELGREPTDQELYPR